MTDSQQPRDGQCHCGAVRFTVTSDFAGLSDCNCSRCVRLGWVMQSVPASAFTLVRGAEVLKSYRFNTHAIEHQFCSECGIEAFARGADGSGAETIVINVNCLDAPPPFERAAVRHWDGRNW
jgi:hypothetical protein